MTPKTIVLAGALLVLSLSVANAHPWFYVNPATGTCQQAPMSPAAYTAEFQAAGMLPQTQVIRDTDSNQVWLAEVKVTTPSGAAAYVDFYSTEAKCKILVEAMKASGYSFGFDKDLQ
jgi:hypothetical protein